jgi:hypothetical protein
MPLFRPGHRGYAPPWGGHTYGKQEYTFTTESGGKKTTTQTSGKHTTTTQTDLAAGHTGSSGVMYRPTSGGGRRTVGTRAAGSGSGVGVGTKIPDTSLEGKAEALGMQNWAQGGKVGPSPREQNTALDSGNLEVGWLPAWLLPAGLGLGTVGVVLVAGAVYYFSRPAAKPKGKRST